MSEKNQSSNQNSAHSQTREFKQAARDEALSAAEKGLEAAREALAAAEKKLAEVQQNCKAAENEQNDARPCDRQEGAGRETAQVPSSQVPSPQAGTHEQPAAQAEGTSQEVLGNQAGQQQPCGAAQAQSAQTQNTQAPNAQTPSSAGASATAPQNSQPFQNQSYWQQEGAAQNQGYGYNQTTQGWYQYQYQSQPVQPHYAAPYASPKDHVAAGLLAIFLGAFGIHKFYLGYNTQGFIMLAISILAGIFTIGLAAGVVWVIAVIEGVLYLTRSQSDFERIYVYGKREWF